MGNSAFEVFSQVLKTSQGRSSIQRSLVTSTQPSSDAGSFPSH